MTVLRHDHRAIRVWAIVLIAHSAFTAAVFCHYPFRYAIAPLFVQGMLAYTADRWLETQ